MYYRQPETRGVDQEPLRGDEERRESSIAKNEADVADAKEASSNSSSSSSNSATYNPVSNTAPKKKMKNYPYGGVSAGLTESLTDSDRGSGGNNAL